MTDIFNYTIFSNFILVCFLIIFFLGFCFESYQNFKQSKEFQFKYNQLLQNYEINKEQLTKRKELEILLKEEIIELKDWIDNDEQDIEGWRIGYSEIDSKLTKAENKIKKLQQKLNQSQRKCKSNNIK